MENTVDIFYHHKLNDFEFSLKITLCILGNFSYFSCCLLCLFVFVALRPMSTAMVIAGRSVHLTTLFSWASLNKQLTSNRAHTFACN